MYCLLPLHISKSGNVHKLFAVNKMDDISFIQKGGKKTQNTSLIPSRVPSKYAYLLVMEKPTGTSKP